MVVKNKIIENRRLNWLASTLSDICSPLEKAIDSEWNYIITLAEEHGVLALLNKKISTLDTIPAIVKETCKRKT